MLSSAFENKKTNSLEMASLIAISVRYGNHANKKQLEKFLSKKDGNT